MTEATVITILAVILLVMPATALICCIYIGYVWWTDHHRPRSKVFGLLLLGAGAIELMALIIEPIAFARVFNILPPPGTGIAIGVAFLVALAVPHVYAFYVASQRRRR